MANISKSASLVVDSCIWIDLAHGNIVTDVFCLPFNLIDPDLMTQEKIHPANWRKLVNLGLVLVPATSDQVLTVASIKNGNPGLSFFDAAALELATREGCKLLTDDKYLKKIAGNYQVEVRGVTWLLNEMAENACLPGYAAFTALCLIHQKGHAIKASEMNLWKKQWAK
jgi:predicted nucleic acid-binding protein